MLISTNDPVHSVRHLVSKYKTDLLIEEKFKIVSIVRMIIEPFSKINFEWDKIIKKIYTDIRVEIH